MQLEKVTRDRALTKAEFHRRLRAWSDVPGEDVVANGVQGRAPWIHVRDGDRLFALNADTPRHAVQAYVQLVTRLGDDVKWTVVPSRTGKMTAVGVGLAKVRVASFYLYLRT